MAAPIVWIVGRHHASPSIAATGALTGVAPGTGAGSGERRRAQLRSSHVHRARARRHHRHPRRLDPHRDGGPAASPPLLVRWRASPRPAPVDGRPVIYTIISPDPATDAPTVGLPNGLIEDTVATGRRRHRDVTLAARRFRRAATLPSSRSVPRARAAPSCPDRASVSSCRFHVGGRDAQHAQRAVLHAIDAFAARPGRAALQAGRPLDGPQLPRPGRPGAGPEPRPSRARRRGRRPGGDSLGEPARVGHRRLRLPRRRAAPTSPSTPRCRPSRPNTSSATPAPWRCSSRPPPGREGARRSRPAAGAAARHRLRRWRARGRACSA